MTPHIWSHCGMCKNNCHECDGSSFLDTTIGFLMGSYSSFSKFERSLVMIFGRLKVQIRKSQNDGVSPRSDCRHWALREKCIPNNLLVDLKLAHL